MPSISKGTRITNSSPAVLVGGVIGLAIVGGLFLTPLPESISSGGEEDLAEPFSGADYIGKVFGDQALEETGTPNQNFVIASRAESPLALLLTSLEVPSTAASSQDNTRVIPVQGLSKKSLRRTRGAAVAFVKKLSPIHESSRSAVREYIAVIEQILAGEGEVSNIHVKKREVAGALIADGVHENLQKRWLGIIQLPKGRLPKDTPVIEEETPEGPFLPEFRLTKVWIRHGYKLRGKIDPKARVVVKLGGYIISDDAHTVEVYRDSDRIKKFRISKDFDDYGRRKFRVKFRKKIRGAVYTFRVLDAYGRAYERAYNFFPRVMSFRWNGTTDGTFSIPWGEYHPLLDKYFLVRVGGVSEQQATEQQRRGGKFETW